ncbi:probable glycosyltransferase At5g03795 [Lycium ferocissimum]|uniref:probable glycosyltransferase At5g03795 n=1 Tax=Lycium ferocissimum TaxID=112874 RepID=UPI002814C9EA|nr:probable glycosyltransferase At5g03795 [Lycium ferocissimum]
MGTELRYASFLETKRLLWLVASIFVMVLMIQYFGFPNVYVVPSLFSSSKGQVAFLGSFQSGESSGNSSLSRNLTFASVLNTTATNVIHEGTAKTELPKTSDGTAKDSNITTNEDTKKVLNNLPAVSLEKNISLFPLQVSHGSEFNVDNHPCLRNIPVVIERSNRARKSVASISQMNFMLQQSRTSFCSMKPRWSSVVDQELLGAKALIENAPLLQSEPGLYAPLFRNLSMFKRSYELMEKTLKVYIYAEGKRPIFHSGPLDGIYASEGWFIKLLQENKIFVTKNPKKAHLFYLPISFRKLKVTLYVPDSHNRTNMIQSLHNYVDMITQKYHFWNRTGGADHFIVACHDWAPAETNKIMSNCIRSLCNADLRGGFQFGKDVSLPQPNIRLRTNPLAELGGKPASKRHTLAFFAGHMHGYLRPILLKHWENKDPDMRIYGEITKASYLRYMKSSKYCICARGSQVNSPRVVEAIYYGCIPVILSDNYVPPLFETLNWEAFAVFVQEKDIPNLKKILLSIPDKKYKQMHLRVKQVQQHFLWHITPSKYDVFHMILHSVWHNRVFGIRPR